MFLRQLDLTTALRPSLYDDETLLFVQDSVGLYEGKYKIPHYQNGHAYLTSHRACYVDNEEPRKFSVAVELKEIERTDFYGGFLKSSPKVTLFPKARKGPASTAAYGTNRNSAPKYTNPADALVRGNGSPTRSIVASPAPTRDVNATWICPICGMSNAVPGNFDASTANQHTPMPPCQACGIKPPLVLMVKASIAAMSSRVNGAATTHALSQQSPVTDAGSGSDSMGGHGSRGSSECPRCTYENHPSMTTCEICGATLQTASRARPQVNEDGASGSESPGPTTRSTIIGDDTIETIKFSFRAGGGPVFRDRLEGALIQRKWLLQSAPPVPKPALQSTQSDGNVLLSHNATPQRPPMPQQRTVGIAGLERRGAELRQNNQAVIGTAFEDLEALMTSAKEVIAMAEQFRNQTDSGLEAATPEARAIINDSASALGLFTTKDMLGSGSQSESLYVTELSRNLAEFLTDDRRGVLRKEGGIMSLVDLWAVFNRLRNGIELVSPLDFEKAANTWDTLHLPIRLRRFKSGLLVVQERSRTDEKTIASLLAWLREPQYKFPPSEGGPLAQQFGRGVTAQETAERFGWSVGVATEELEMGEEVGSLCRDQCLDGLRFWENHLMRAFEGESEVERNMQKLDELHI